MWPRAATSSATSRPAGPSGTTSIATRCAPIGKARAATSASLASRLSGSSDIFQRGGRGPTASINFVTAHDGFTLEDLVSYNEKHNEANLEQNRDGSDNHRSWNCGVEGPSDDPPVRALRQRQKRNFLATLFFSQGVPMLVAGDELGRSQRGNNNAYCQDNELSWLDWEFGRPRARRASWRSSSRLRNRHPLFRRRTYFRGRAVRDRRMKDISWLNPDGTEMSDEDWNKSFARALGVLISGRGLTERNELGRPVEDDDVLLLLNAHDETITFIAAWARGRGLGCAARHEQRRLRRQALRQRHPLSAAGSLAGAAR